MGGDGGETISDMVFWEYEMNVDKRPTNAPKRSRYTVQFTEGKRGRSTMECNCRLSSSQ